MNQGISPLGGPQQFLSLSNPLPIGATMQMPDLGPFCTLGDGSVWLRSGALVPSSQYPDAAKLPTLRAHSVQGAISGFAGAMTCIATDGNGNYVGVYASVTALLQSADGGKNWNSRTQATGVAIDQVIWSASLGLFVAAGNNGTQQAIVTSPDGVTWSANRIPLTSPNAPFGASQCRLACNADGSLLVFYNSSGSGDIIYTSTNAVTWTRRTTGTPITAAAMAGGLAVDGNRILIGATAFGIYYSQDGGATFTPASTPFSAHAQVGYAAINGVFMTVVGQTLYYSANPVNSTAWSAVEHGADPNTFYVGSRNFTSQFSPDRKKIIGVTSTNGSIVTSSDGIFWTPQGTDAAVSASGPFAAGTADMVIGAAGGTPKRGDTSPFGRCNVVGRTPSQKSQGYTSAGTSGQVNYYRIK